MRWAWAAAVIGLAALWAQEGASTGKISGVVRDAATGQPIEGASVILDGGTSVQSDQNGLYRISNVAAGAHEVTARARNSLVIQATPRAQSRSLRVGPGAEVTADFRLPRLASIEGTVIDEDRRPLKGQMVAVAARHYGLGGIGYTRLGGVTTNTDGRYRIDGLPAGEPLLVETNRVLTETAESAGAGKPIGVDTYYPHATSPEDAEEITLSPDETRTRLEIRQVRAAAYCVSGTIHGSGASAAVIVSKPGPILAPFAQSVAKPAREFRVCGLPRGEYLFEIISADGQGARLQAAQSVTVTNRDLDGMNVTLLPERSLRTRLVWDKADTPAAPVGRIEIALVDRRSSARLMTAPDATVPGSLRPATEPLLDYACLTTFSSPVVYIKDLRYGEESVLGRVMHSSGGVLTMVMARDGATVSATAMSGDKAEADASIAIMPVSSESEAEFAAALQFGHTDQSGRVEFAVDRAGQVSRDRYG